MMPSSVTRSISIIGQAVSVAIFATTGRLSLRTIGRALISLNVKRAGDMRMLPVFQSLTKPFLARARRCKFTIEYTFEEDDDATVRREDPSANSRRGLCAVSPARL